MESATENIPPEIFWVRVKTRGKSTCTGAVMYWLGKPHSEQDKVGELGNLSFMLAGMSLR